MISVRYYCTTIYWVLIGWRNVIMLWSMPWLSKLVKPWVCICLNSIQMFTLNLFFVSKTNRYNNMYVFSELNGQKKKIQINLKIRNIGLLLRNKRYLLIKNYYSTSPDHQTETVTAFPALSDVTLIKLFAEIFVYNGVAAFLWTLNCILICCCCARFSSTKILSLFKPGLPHLASACVFCNVVHFWRAYIGWPNQDKLFENAPQCGKRALTY